MKFIRHILSHSVLLIAIAALVLAYIYRSHLFPQYAGAIDAQVNRVLAVVGLAEKQKPQQSDEQGKAADKPVTVAANKTTTTQAKKPEQVTSDASATTAAETTDSTATGAGTEFSAAANTPESDASKIETADTATVATETSTAAETAKAETADTDTTAVKTDQVVTTSDPIQGKTENTTTQTAKSEQAADKSPATQKASEPAAVSSDKEAVKKSHSDLLNQARLAFQNGQMEKSVDLYKELIELNPDEPNAFGEMGNVYYAQGRWQQAGEAYYQAAILLIEQGQTGQVQYLYRVIQGLDQKSAEKLRMRLSQGR